MATDAWNGAWSDHWGDAWGDGSAPVIIPQVGFLSVSVGVVTNCAVSAESLT